MGFAMLLWVPLPSLGAAQAAQSNAREHVTRAAHGSTIPALFVSDIHINPFRDPAKVPQLVNAPVSRWNVILSKPDSPDQAQAYTKLQQSCHTRTLDTSYGLFRSTLQAMQARQSHPKFITVSGDLVVHDFPCLYAAVFPNAAAGDQEKFVLKTIHFVVNELRASFPGARVYVALGNHDTPCDHDAIDAGTNFLAQLGRILAAGLPQSAQMKEFAENGSYSVMMPSPMRNTRLISVNDLFLKSDYKTCSGKRDFSTAGAEMAWLKSQLAQARRMGQKVWILGHVPPGVSPGRGALCGGKPSMYLATDRLANLMTQYADIIRLGVFGHTHSDEIHLLEPESKPDAGLGRAVPIKVVPSITPSGHDSAFIVAQVNPASAVLMNYTVVAANGDAGADTTWSREYVFREAYKKAEFTPTTVRALIAEFAADPAAKTEASQQYIRSIRPGKSSSILQAFWPQYVCAISNASAKGYTACACPTAK